MNRKRDGKRDFSEIRVKPTLASSFQQTVEEPSTFHQQPGKRTTREREREPIEQQHQNLKGDWSTTTKTETRQRKPVLCYYIPRQG